MAVRQSRIYAHRRRPGAYRPGAGPPRGPRHTIRGRFV